MDDLKYQIDLMTAMNEKLMQSEHIYRAVAEFSGNLYIFKDCKRDLGSKLVGPWDEVLDEKISNKPYDPTYMRELLCDDDQKLFIETIDHMEKVKEKRASCEVMSKSGKYYECEAMVNYASDGSPIEKIISFRDISKTKAKNDELVYLAYYDSLTGLYNRNYFVKSLRDMCEKADREKVSVELLFVDIDDFKKINDSIGLLFGDELVQSFAAIIKDCQNENIFAGRFGSDVFCIAIYNPCGQRSADNIYRTIREKIRTPFVLTNKTEVSFTISAGVAEYPEAGRSALELIKNAEIVLYKAKDKGHDAIQYFEHEILRDFIKTVSLEQKLKDAIDNEDFVLYFQPQFEINTGKLRGAEALIRWPDKEGGFILSPSEFIPIAEKNGAIVPIGSWVLKEAIKLMQNWKFRFHLPFVVSVNVSAIQLEKDNFIEYIQTLLDVYEIEPKWLELEITEEVYISDYDSVAEKLSQLRRMGIKIALDDFGTGFSSLSYLKDMPIDTLKLDKSFIESTVSDRSMGIVTGAVVEMARKLNIITVAEGVETTDVLSFLKQCGCNEIQGYLTGKPMNKSDFEKLIIRQLP